MPQKLGHWKLYIFSSITTVLLLVLGIPLMIINNPRSSIAKETTVKETRELASSDEHRIPLQLKDGKVIEIPMEEYLVGVLAGEMSPLDPLEALKAMAVAARSYAWHRTSNGDPICTTIHCQVWLSPEERQERWGQKTSDYTGLIKQAVKDTQGQFLVYDNDVILATYSDSCGGHTESAADEWGSDIPYLRSVTCPEKPVIKDILFSPDELDAKLGTTLSAMKPRERIKAVQITDKTSSGRTKTVQIGLTEVKGSRLRAALGLPSTDMKINWNHNEIEIETRGNGHAVGMCQSGDITMAIGGKSYDEILAHYYPGTQLNRMY
ncbi:stage II sporulation protein D [Heliobacterium chlorum]|uniref:Stage II sporulation protein D n=1 Tax=Heliobacterium chlorum TaxID=2698 RepID=A0ABR7T789_HELCL|nr:stage II sporulation protein D [Heliobacterium chlorum]MBC9786629.1 stage II sporulation protein D [Heliobacterium chlorum]